MGYVILEITARVVHDLHKPVFTAYHHQVGVGDDLQTGGPMDQVQLTNCALSLGVVEQDFLVQTVPRVDDDVFF